MISFTLNGFKIKKQDVNRSNRISLSITSTNNMTKITTSKYISISFNSIPDILIYINQMFSINSNPNNLETIEKMLKRIDKMAIIRDNHKFNYNDIISEKNDVPYHLGSSNKISLGTSIRSTVFIKADESIKYDITFMVMISFNSPEISNQIIDFETYITTIIQNHIRQKILKRS